MSLHAKRIKTKSSYIGKDILKDINTLLDSDVIKKDKGLIKQVVSIDRRYIEIVQRLHNVIDIEKALSLAVPRFARGSTRLSIIQHLKSIRFLLHKLNTHEEHKETRKLYRKKYGDE